MATLKQKLLGGVTLLTLFEASGAVAAPPLTPSWTGFYFGGHVGYSWGSLNGDTTHTVLIPTGPSFVTVPNPVAISALGRDIDPSGGLGGLQLGYNYQVGSVVYGVEGDVTWTGQRDTFNFNGTVPNLNTEDFLYQETTAAKLRYMGTVRGRLGYAYGAFLPYLTGGLAWGRMAMDLSWVASQRPTSCPVCTIFATRSFAGSESHTLFGWTIGGGFEYAFADRWSAKAEYLFVDLGNKTFFSGVPAGGSFGLHDHIVRLGINFRP
ncbi:MAG: outer membrane beta-barrel protein [Pseudolabrys sp.]